MKKAGEYKEELSLRSSEVTKEKNNPLFIGEDNLTGISGWFVPESFNNKAEVPCTNTLADPSTENRIMTDCASVGHWEIWHH